MIAIRNTQQLCKIWANSAAKHHALDMATDPVGVVQNHEFKDPVIWTDNYVVLAVQRLHARGVSSGHWEGGCPAAPEVNSARASEGVARKARKEKAKEKAKAKKVRKATRETKVMTMMRGTSSHPPCLRLCLCQSQCQVRLELKLSICVLFCSLLGVIYPA